MQSIRQRRAQLLLSGLVILMLWLPRGLGLDRFATADENAWLTRSANFYWALSRADWAATFQRHHPGVTLTWAGTVGFLTNYPGYVNDTTRNFGWLAEELPPFLREHGHEPMALLAAGRAVAVFWIVLALALTFFFARRRWGLWPALAAVALVAFDPFHLAHSRLLHLDGLLSSLMLLAVVALFVAFDQQELLRWQRSALLTAGMAAGFAWLTRSPGLFLLPFAGLLAIGAGVQAQRQGHKWLGSIQFLLGQLFLWALLGVVTFFLFWPVMWVDPWGSLTQVFSAANAYATEGHADPIFFNGTVYNGDPGFWFYPRTWLWRVTPVGLLGVLLGIVGLVHWRRRTDAEESTPANHMADNRRTDLVLLLLYALLFTLFMNWGAKKFDRYLLPVYPALDLVAGLGWFALVSWVSTRQWRQWGQRRQRGQFVVGILLGVVIVAQAATALPQYPYYLTSYNPLLGGNAAAPDVMQIGRGEGAELAAQWLNTQPNAEATTVASSFPNGPFSYFYAGRTVPHTFWTMADYAVVYRQDFQRRMPSPRQIAWVETLTPVHEINLHGINYAKIYDLRTAPPPDFVTTWAAADTPQIRLNAYELTTGQVAPGESIRVTFYLENLAQLAADLNVLVRLVGADGIEVTRSEGWPWGAPTTTWEVGTIWPDGHTLTVPSTAAPGLYRLELSFYDPATQTPLTATQPSNGDRSTGPLLLDFIQVGTQPLSPAMTFEPPYQFGTWTTLVGYTAGTSTGRRIDIGRTPLLPGEDLLLTLFWQVDGRAATNYTTFVHIVDNTGTMLTQQDQPPTNALVPTTLWRKGQLVADEYRLSIPAGAALGTYQIYVGLYDPATGDRLPVQQEDAVVGDSVPLTRLVIALSRGEELQQDRYK